MKKAGGRKIPRCMSSQHPDNVNLPFFAGNSVLGGEEEIIEAHYVFSHLLCTEQMWDSEGKEVDSSVVMKLLAKYSSFFREKRLGRDLFLTLRVPNPEVEKDEAKILAETLESIPRSFDAAKALYGDDIVPIFEVILPMTTSANSLNRVYHYYRQFVVGKENKSLGDITVGQWIGQFKPETINVIPLFEDKDSMLNAAQITREYLEGKDIPEQRVFLARSDTALNYGLVSSVLFNKIALHRLEELSKKSGVEIYPIIGVGSAPFRGNLKPQTVERVALEYPSVYTFTVQSAFKFDNPPDLVREAIKKLDEREVGPAQKVEVRRCLEIAQKYSQEYQRQVGELSAVINDVARFVPARRKRKLHIGLFGYSRNLGKIKLPRAITFTAALYSLGIPPEILGLNALSKTDLQFLSSVYINFRQDLADALRFADPDSPFLPVKLKPALKSLLEEYSQDREHQKITRHITSSLKQGHKEDLGGAVLAAANLRRFLG